MIFTSKYWWKSHSPHTYLPDPFAAYLAPAPPPPNPPPAPNPPPPPPPARVEVIAIMGVKALGILAAMLASPSDIFSSFMALTTLSPTPRAVP